MREIVIDTETTGFDPLGGHRIVEIGAVELVDRSPTGRTFHCYLNPERAIPADTVAVHGLTAEFLADKPLIADVASELLAFVGDAPLVAQFDWKRSSDIPLTLPFFAGSNAGISAPLAQ
jgi:DNA polymerase III subunit epsilon